MKNFARRWVIVRGENFAEQTLGRLYVFEGKAEIMQCCTLELPDRENKRNISRIPAGRYMVEQRWTEKFKSHFHVKNVPGRSGILTHTGNFYYQIEGCVLVGSDFKDINGDELPDVINSTATLSLLVKTMPRRFYVDIVDPAPGE